MGSRKKHIRVLSLWLICLFIAMAPAVLASSFMDDFEDGNMDGWSLECIPWWAVPCGNPQISTDYAHSGTYSLGLYDHGGVKRDGFTAMEGIYEAWFYIRNYVGDANIFFQYQDSDHYYRVYMCPDGTDNPEFWLFSVNGGSVNSYKIYQVSTGTPPPPFSRYEWFKVTVHRYSNGDIEIYINDVLELNVNDTQLMDPGKFILKSWVEAYADDVSFNVSVLVLIDIKPGSYPNALNLRSKGVTPVAILTTPDFDATTVDPSTVTFGKTGTEASPAHEEGHIEDVDGDGDDDMVLHFNTQDTGIESGDTEAILMGKVMINDKPTPIKGVDSIEIVGAKASPSPGRKVTDTWGNVKSRY